MGSSDTKTDLDQLIATARFLASPGKGILASDESPSTLGRRLEKFGIENTEENRRCYRELFYTAPIGNYISGAILFPEALLQSSSEGKSFVDCLTEQGVLPGVKVDEGLRSLPGTDPIETDTKGLDSLVERCRLYRQQGARFAKWRAALRVPTSEAALETNSLQLAEYAAICHETGLVPIVEPELLMDGSHDANQFESETIRVISACITALNLCKVRLEAILLKPQMVLSGSEYGGQRLDPQEVAERTLRALRHCVPPAIPGVMFLSGGQSEVEATVNLNALNVLKVTNGDRFAPWSLSFSFGRGLQASVLKLWAEDQADIEVCRRKAAALACANGMASLGKFEGNHPAITATGASLKESFRGWRP